MHCIIKRVITKRYRGNGFSPGILTTSAEFKTWNNREVTEDYTLHNHSLLLVDSVAFVQKPSQTSHEATAVNLKVCEKPLRGAVEAGLRFPEFAYCKIPRAANPFPVTDRDCCTPVSVHRESEIEPHISSQSVCSFDNSAQFSFTPGQRVAFLRCTPMHCVICWRASRSALVGQLILRQSSFAEKAISGRSMPR